MMVPLRPDHDIAFLYILAQIPAVKFERLVLRTTSRIGSRFASISAILAKAFSCPGRARIGMSVPISSRMRSERSQK